MDPVEPPDGTALRAIGLRKTFVGVPAVESVDLDVPVGVVLGLLGPNGAGKTTLIRMLTTVLVPDAGRFWVAGIPHTRPDDVRRLVGVLPEGSGHPEGQTGLEWLTFHGRLFGRSRDDARSTGRRLLGEVGLADRGGSLISTYSRGMHQRLGVARALVNDPQVMFLDEPTLGLDPLGQRQILDLIARVTRERGVTVVLSTHVLADVEEICDQVIILNHGRILAQGSVAEVARLAAAPRQAVLRVAPQEQARALALIEAADGAVTARSDGRPGTLRLTLPPAAEAGSGTAPVLRELLAAGVPVLGLALEEGRLSDAFLEVTREPR